MSSEGVVDALWKVHRALRPRGVLLDLHPPPQTVQVEVRAGTGFAPVGQLEYSSSFDHTISAADEALASFHRQGSFLKERELEFTVLQYLDSLADWETYMATWGQYYVPLDERLVKSIHGLFDSAKAPVILREWIQATCFRRSG